jgi:hypothetical protein
MIKQVFSSAYKYVLRKKYGLTPEKWMKIFESQGVVADFVNVRNLVVDDGLLTTTIG